MLQRHRQLIYNKPPPSETVDEGYRTYAPKFDFSVTTQPTSSYNHLEVEYEQKQFYEFVYGRLEYDEDPASTGLDEENVDSCEVESSFSSFLSCSLSAFLSSMADESLYVDVR